MNTSHLSKTLSLGLWIAVGAFGCSSNTSSGPGNGSVQTGGSTSGSSNSTATSLGGNVGTGGSTQSNGTGGSTSSGDTGGSSNASTGGTTGDTTTTGTKSTGGTKAVGGATSTGGKSGSGGTKSSGGSSTRVGTGTGGKSTAGGMSSTGGTKASTGGVSAAGGTSSQSGTCTITVKNASYSSKIGSVGIVTWSTTLANVDSAEIEFGVDTSYGLSAPVDLKQTDYRTVLLGMKQNHDPYHFRIKARSGSTECVGPDNVFTGKTAARPNAIKPPTVTTNNKAALFGGFIVLEGYRLSTSGGGDYAFILDADGDAVWWYQPPSFGSLSVAKMTYDGKSIWIANDNVPENSAGAKVGRVKMDGDGWEDLSAQFPRFNHDLTVLPDETVIFVAYGSNGCDDVKERSPSGTVRTIINSGKAFGNATACHCNAIQYDPSDDSVIVSEDDRSGYFKTDRQGNIKWVLNGGTYNSFDKSGGGASGWVGNHNLHILGPDHILFFNNGVAALQPGTKPAVAREITLDLTKMTTTEIWKYESSPSISNGVMGDVQRLENGNTIIAYSTAGTIHEVDANKTVLQTLVWSGLGSAGFGYITKRKTLYGAPPR